MANQSTSKKSASSSKKRKTKAAIQKNKWIKIAVITLSVIAFLVFAGIIAYNCIVDYYIGKINIISSEKDLNLEYVTQAIVDENGQSSVMNTEDLIEDANGALNADNLPLICDNKNVKNILLLADDTRGKEAGRTDSMILVSINKKTEKIIMCSFMRDIMAKYPKTPASPVAGKYDKLNHAHAYGGAELTMAVLKETFNIEVSHYAKVNFSVFRDIVDAMGGVDMYLTAAEARAINSILSETMQEPANKTLRVTGKDMLKSTKAGTYHLTGVQALSHARNRRVGSDFQRTQRQRDVLTAMAQKAKTLSLPQLHKLLETVLPMVTTNMSEDLLKDLVGDMLTYLSYEIVSTRVPADGMFTENSQGFYKLIPDYERNCFALYELVYGEKAPGGPTGKGPTYKPPATTKAPVTTTTPPTSTEQNPPDQPDGSVLPKPGPDDEKDPDKDDEKDPDKDTEKEPDKDTDQDPDKDTGKDPDKETDKDTDKDTDQDTDQDNPAGTETPDPSTQPSGGSAPGENS